MWGRCGPGGRGFLGPLEGVGGRLDGRRRPAECRARRVLMRASLPVTPRARSPPALQVAGSAVREQDGDLPDLAQHVGQAMVAAGQLLGHQGIGRMARCWSARSSSRRRMAASPGRGCGQPTQARSGVGPSPVRSRDPADKASGLQGWPGDVAGAWAPVERSAGPVSDRRPGELQSASGHAACAGAALR